MNDRKYKEDSGYLIKLKRVVIYWINKCTTNWLFFSFFSPPDQKRGGEKENEIAKLFLI